MTAVVTSLAQVFTMFLEAHPYIYFFICLYIFFRMFIFISFKPVLRTTNYYLLLIFYQLLNLFLYPSSC